MSAAMEVHPMIIDLSDPDSPSKAARQAKKLQLRNSGFKARDMPARNRTPSRPHSATNDPDNKTPNSVLREISNSTKRRAKQPRSRIDSTVFVYSDENAIQSPKMSDIVDISPLSELDSPQCAPSPSPTRTKSPSKHTPASRLRRHSVGLDTSRYIEHLEAELAAVQVQLSAMTSPTQLQARSHKMRALNAETRALQDEVTSWERKFHDRVQEEIAERTNLEAALKARVRLLEGDVTDYTQKIQDLQAQLDKDQRTIAVTESANFELERRIDAISGLLTSPKKSELERSNSAARSRHSRQRSMLPRFPTTGSLNLAFTPRVPEEAGDPTTPTVPAPEMSPSAQQLSQNRSPIDQDFKEALESGAHLQRTISGDIVPLSARKKRASWAHTEAYSLLEPTAASTSKPSRRMRRFHAGIVMPKPLLLPSATSYSNALPQTSPKESSPSAAAPPASSSITEWSTFAQMASARNFECLMSTVPGNGRRRALTSIEDVAAAMRRATNPFMSPMPFPAALGGVGSRPSTATSSDSATSSGGSESTFTIIGDVSSLGPPPFGRNLYDELQRAREPDLVEADDSSFTPRSSIRSNGSDRTQRPGSAGSSCAFSTTGTLRRRARKSHRRSYSDTTAISALKAAEEEESEEEIERGAGWVVNQVFKHTYDKSRHCLDHAQALAFENDTFQRLQWWLVQLFLGPVATRQMISTAARHGQRQKRARRIEMLSGGNIASRSFARNHMWEPSIWVEGMNDAKMQVVRNRSLPMRWIQKHSPWLWIRFSIALLFAIGAAIRDGPSVVMGLEEQEEFRKD